MPDVIPITRSRFGDGQSGRESLGTHRQFVGFPTWPARGTCRVSRPAVRYKVDPSPTQSVLYVRRFPARGSAVQARSRGSRFCLNGRLRASRTRTRRRSRCVRRVRPTSRIGPNYNLRRFTKKTISRFLLSDLCRVVPQPATKHAQGRGRPTVPLCDAIFAVVFKVYSTLSARRFMSDLAGSARARPRL